jgi:two-component system phosphate regulon sensor histidine kinase PhoR
MPLVTGDSDELTQVFQNLIENAIKYSGNGSTCFRFLLSPPKQGKSHLCIMVEDTGEGIEPTQIPRLTERFYRVDKGRSRAQGGTGLGLAIVKHILIRHRGWLKISSQLEKGSIFAVYLPVSKEKD